LGKGIIILIRKGRSWLGRDLLLFRLNFNSEGFPGIKKVGLDLTLGKNPKGERERLTKLRVVKESWFPRNGFLGKGRLYSIPGDLASNFQIFNLQTLLEEFWGLIKGPFG